MKLRFVIGGGTVFALGVVVGLALAADKKVDPTIYQGKPPEQAARALLEAAQVQAGSGSWQNIAVARVYYLMGDRAAANAILERFPVDKLKGNDWIRIGRLYVEAGEWDKAKEAFDHLLAVDPDDPDYQAEIGAFYNLHGDRARAEELFARSFAKDPSDVWATANAAGSYVSVRPQ
jgi:tetratricopeptide (TPR) repeat protein